jgi:DNA-binding Lrp family transcriptional regulator
MKQLKELDYKILYELMKNAKISDREIAKALNVSQPTVSRRRAFLERELIEGYTVIPKWEKLGYRIFAMTFVKIKPVFGTKEEYADARKRGTEWLMSQHYIVMSGGCRGMGVDAFNLSFHKSYSDYDNFMRNLRLEMGDLIEDVKSVLVNLTGKELIKPPHLKYLTQV